MDEITYEDLINDFDISTEKQEQRLNLCRICEYFIAEIQECSMCHCFMPNRVKKSLSHCPINKWGIER